MKKEDVFNVEQAETIMEMINSNSLSADEKHLANEIIIALTLNSISNELSNINTALKDIKSGISRLCTR